MWGLSPESRAREGYSQYNSGSTVSVVHVVDASASTADKLVNTNRLERTSKMNREEVLFNKIHQFLKTCTYI